MTDVRVVDGFGVAGRFGNQLIQVGTTVALAENHGAVPVFHDDWRYRHVYSLPGPWYGGRARRAAAVPVESLAELAELTGPLVDYLQDLRWWEPSLGTIRDALTLNPSSQVVVADIWDAQFGDVPGPCGVVHVRRGDNVTNDPGTINCLPGSYYRDGIAMFPDVRSWLVFSDDPVWCREHFADKASVVFEGVPRSKEHDPGYQSERVLDWVDFELMRVAVGRGAPFVMSNSSYALMVAVLEDARRVVFPSYWYGDVLIGELGARPDLLFPGWLTGGWQRVHVDDPNPLVVSC